MSGDFGCLEGEDSIDSYANLPSTSHGTDKTRKRKLTVRDFRWIPPLGLGMGIDAAISILAVSKLEHVFTHFSLVLFTHLWCWRVVSSSTATSRTAWRSLLLFSLAKAIVKDSY